MAEFSYSDYKKYITNLKGERVDYFNFKNKIIVAGTRVFRTHLKDECISIEQDFYLKFSNELLDCLERLGLFDGFYFKEINREWQIKNEVVFVSGMAKGPDMAIAAFCDDHDLVYMKMPADWDKNGRSAGIIRNEEMAKFSKGGYLIAFWDNKSRGTKNIIDCANRYKIKTEIIDLQNIL